jgi:amino acid permease
MLNLAGMSPMSPTSPTTFQNADGDINIKPSRHELSPTAGSRRTFYNRTFSKLQKGSLRGGIFNMISAGLGGGVLSLSFVFALSGWVIGLILLAVGCIAGIWSNLIIAKIAIKHNLKNLDEVAFMAGGNFLRKFLQIMMVVYVTGACIGYQIFIGQLLSYFFKQVLPLGDEDFIDSFEFRLLVNGPIAGLILLPLSLKRDMSSLAFAGVLSVAALTYTLVVMSVETPFYWNEYKNAPQTIIYAVKFDWNILTSCSLVFFAYTC